MSRLNNIWQFNQNLNSNSDTNLNLNNQNQQTNQLNIMNHLQQTQFLLLQQQLQQQILSNQSNEMNQFQIHQQQGNVNKNNQKFTSSFSVNNLLNSPTIFPTSERQPVQQQIAAAMLTQHLAAFMTNYRQQQLNKIQKPSFNNLNQESAFYQPQPGKRQRLNENIDIISSEQNQINTSLCSISSPSSSSTTSAASISLDYSNSQNHNTYPSLNESESIINNSQNNENISGRNSPELLCSSSSTSPSVSSFSSFKRSSRKRQLSIDLGNLNCPICGVFLNGLDELKAHYEFEMNKLNNDYFKQDKLNIDTTLSNQIIDTINSRYLKFIEIKESRQQRLIRKCNLRLRKNTKENLNIVDTCKLDNNKKSINKREFDDIDQESMTGSDLNNKRVKLINSGNSADEISETDEDDELINVVDNDEDDNQNKNPKDELNESDLVEEENSNESNFSGSKCNNCSNVFKNALVSVKCWHVNCKKCWLKSGDKDKKCPQCNTTCVLKDLKKIFL